MCTEAKIWNVEAVPAPAPVAMALYGTHGELGHKNTVVEYAAFATETDARLPRRRRQQLQLRSRGKQPTRANDDKTILGTRED